MSHDITQLKKLQDILIARNDLKQKIIDLPKNISTKRELLARVQKAYKNNLELVEQKRQEAQALRNELEKNERERESRESKMDQVKTQREYEALEKEIREHSESEGLIRENQENINSEILQLTDTIKEEKELIELQENEMKSEEVAMKSDLTKIENKLKTLEKEKVQVSHGFDEEFLFKFQRIISTLDGEGIVALRSTICTGCNMILPNHLANKVRNQDEILFCPYCSKALYSEMDNNDSANKQYADADIVETFDESMGDHFELNDIFADTDLNVDIFDSMAETGEKEEDTDERMDDDLDESSEMITEDDERGLYDDSAHFDGMAHDDSDTDKIDPLDMSDDDNDDIVEDEVEE